MTDDSTRELSGAVNHSPSSQSPQGAGEPVAWRVVRGSKLVVGMVTADREVRDAWLEAELVIEPLYAIPSPAVPRGEEIDIHPATKKGGFAFPKIVIDWDQINAQQFASSRAALLAKLTRFMSSESKETVYWSDNHFNRSEMYVLHELLKAATTPDPAQRGEAIDDGSYTGDPRLAVPMADSRPASEQNR